MKSASTFDGPNQFFIVRRNYIGSLVKIGNINTILGWKILTKHSGQVHPGQELGSNHLPMFS